MKVIWLRSARKQLEEILEYISSDSPAQAEIYVSDLFERTNRILDFPEIGMFYQTMGRHVIRRLVIGKTKSVFYRVEHGNVFVLTIRDDRTDWK